MCSLLLPCLRKITDPLHIPDNTCQIIHILTMTFRTFMQVSLINMLTFIANGIRYIKCKVITAFYSSYPK